MNKVVLNELIKSWSKRISGDQCYEDSTNGHLQRARDGGFEDGISKCIDDLQALIDLFE